MVSITGATIALSCVVALQLWSYVNAKGGGEITADPRMRLCGLEIIAAHIAHCEQREKRYLNGMFYSFSSY